MAQDFKAIAKVGTRVAITATLAVVTVLACGGKATDNAPDSGGLASGSDGGDGPSGTGSSGSGASSSGVGSGGVVGSSASSSGSGSGSHTSSIGNSSGGSSGGPGSSSSGSGGGVTLDDASAVCTRTSGGGSSGAGSCAILDKEVCGNTGYEIDCQCPEATCTCTCCGSTVHQVTLSTCPACPTAAQAYALCGFPH